MDLLNPPRLDKKAVIKFFNRAAKSYDNAAILQEEVLNRLLQRFEYMRHQPETIVDIGCGTGKGVRGLQKAFPGARVYASDIAYQMLLQARSSYRLLSKKRLVAADMERLPFNAAAFDLVFSSLALPWCNDLKLALQEIARVAIDPTTRRRGDARRRQRRLGGRRFHRRRRRRHLGRGLTTFRP